MWPFRKRISLKDSGIFKNFTDCHSHILPGVDDGVQTMEEALEILRLYEELGIKSVWLTPHIMEDMPNTCLLYTSPSPRDRQKSRMPSSA